jgi:phage gp36-like protein
MAYCTQQDMIGRFGDEELIQLTDRAQLNEIDAAIITQAIADAGAEIDGYLAGVYPLPLATVPLQLTRISCDMARYYLHLAKGIGSESDPIGRRYAHAVKYLNAVATGSISLEVAAEDAPADSVSQSAGSSVFDAGQTNWP